ncbi:MAG: ATP-binding protein [Candidatus Zixiibacteriota bacterium]|nr:PAS domain-containing protein [candidate division Zixibacteria bacterium]MBU1471866.1 PAS domain-containing protein [candidate division Zixibacteria bacterium]
MKSDTTSEIPKGLTQLAHRTLFEEVPFCVAVIDRNYNVVMANRRFTAKFGDWRGKKCYSVYKKLHRPCDECPSAKVFEDGSAVVADAVGLDQHGKPTHYVGHIAPLRSKKNGPVEYVLEMTRTVTGTKSWQQEYQILFDRVPCYITVIDRDYRIVRANEAFREKFGDVMNHYCYEVYKRRKSKCTNCPAAKTFRDSRVHRSNQAGIGSRGQDIHYAVTTSPLVRSGESVAHVIEISTDITAVKRLESQVIKAERLGAVGQTVAGLAHSIKNILMGLEGGKYIVSMGLKQNDRKVINEGWEMLERNFEKTTSLVKDFLSFSKGRLPELRMISPTIIVKDIVRLYKDIAAQSGIELKADIVGKVHNAPLDPDGLHTCLTNLISNAIDACQMGEQKGTEVMIRLTDRSDKLVFEVSDNGSGIEYDVKKKIFTTFFTTKGGEGTGLGLLTTRKIVQEHGGTITVVSKEGEGSCFRMEFPRKRLMALYEEGRQKGE